MLLWSKYSRADFVVKLLHDSGRDLIWLIDRQSGRKLITSTAIVTKLKYRFIVFSVFSFGIRYISVFGIPISVSVSVTDPGLTCTLENPGAKFNLLHKLMKTWLLV